MANPRLATRLLGLGAVLIALSSADAAPAGRAAPAPASSGTAIFIPPIVRQQIPTASRPIQPLPPGRPIPAPARAPVVEGSGSSSPDGVSSIADLDRGAALWLFIAPAYDPSRVDPLTNVDPLVGTGHADPLPQATEVPIGEHLSMGVPTAVRHQGVPGIDPVTSGSGNRALWFERR